MIARSAFGTVTGLPQEWRQDLVLGLNRSPGCDVLVTTIESLEPATVHCSIP
jgi:hypothetical protein